MAKNKEGRPEWFKFWRRNRGMLDIESLSMESRGIIFTNIMRYFDTGTVELIQMSPVEEFAFHILKQSADEAMSEYEKRVKTNQKNGEKGGRPKTQVNRKKPTGLLITQVNRKKPLGTE